MYSACKCIGIHRFGYLKYGRVILGRQLFHRFEHPIGWNWPIVAVGDFEQVSVHANVAKIWFSIVSDQDIGLRRHNVSFLYYSTENWYKTYGYNVPVDFTHGVNILDSAGDWPYLESQGEIIRRAKKMLDLR